MNGKFDIYKLPECLRDIYFVSYIKDEVNLMRANNFEQRKLGQQSQAKDPFAKYADHFKSAKNNDYDFYEDIHEDDYPYGDDDHMDRLDDPMYDNYMDDMYDDAMMGDPFDNDEDYENYGQLYEEREIEFMELHKNIISQPPSAKKKDAQEDEDWITDEEEDEVD